MTRDEFEQRYTNDNADTLAALRHHGRYAIPCECDDPDCKGWQMASLFYGEPGEIVQIINDYPEAGDKVGRHKLIDSVPQYESNYLLDDDTVELLMQVTQTAALQEKLGELAHKLETDEMTTVQARAELNAFCKEHGIEAGEE